MAKILSRGCAVSSVIILGLFAFTVWRCGPGALPSDASLKRQFARHRSELQRLRQMVVEDDLNGRVHEDYVDDKKLSSQRVAQYRRLMKTAGVELLVAQGRAKPVEFAVDGTGFLDVGTYKGFSYSEQQQDHLAKSLDDSCDSPNLKGGYCSAVEPLGGNWWLIRYEYF